MTEEPLPVIIIGGGVSGIACAMSLADRGRPSILCERRAFLGGRATSFTDRDTEEEIDNCQHVVLGCCTNAIDLFENLGVADAITFHDAFTYIEPGGRRHRFAASPLPAPLHFAPALLRFGALVRTERRAVVRAFRHMMSMDHPALVAASRQTMSEWLTDRRQPPRAISRFWEPILVSAVNEDLDRVSALPCLQVFLQGFMPHRRAAEMGVPDRPLESFYGRPAREYVTARGGQVWTRTAVRGVVVEDERVAGVELSDGRVIPAAAVVVATPPVQARRLFGEGRAPFDMPPFDFSPITGIHLWFDQPVLDLPHCVLLDSPIQWVFDKTHAPGTGQRLQAVVSASHDLSTKSKDAIISLTLGELESHLPRVSKATLLRGVVVKENRATISLTPDVIARRPGPRTRVAGLVLAGDWTDTGWPATIEGSVRSGRIAAATVMGEPPRLTADLPRAALARLLMRRVPNEWPSPRRTD